MEALFLRFRDTRDRQALATLFARARPKLLKLARLYDAPGIESDDLVQATFVRAIEHADRYDATRPLLAWMSGIMANIVREEGRRARRRADAERVRRDEIDPPEVQLAASELQQAVEQAISELPAPYKEVVAMRLRGVGAAEISRRMQCPVATVRARLQRGLRRLRARLPHGIGALIAMRLSAQPTSRRGAEWEATRRTRSAPWIGPAVVLIAAAALLPLVLPPSTATSAASHGGIATEPSERHDEAYAHPIRRRVVVTRPQALPKFRLMGRVLGRSGERSDSTELVVYRGESADLDIVLPDMGEPVEVDGCAVLARTTIRPDSTFRVDGLACRDLRLQVVAPTRALCAPRVLHVASGSEFVSAGVMETYEGAFVSGRLARDLAGEEVVLEARRSYERPCSANFADTSMMLHNGVMRTTVSKDGTFRFRAVWPSSEVTISVRPPGCLYWTRLHDVCAGERRSVVLARCTSRVDVTAIEPGGTPLEGAPVRIVEVPAVRALTLGARPRAVTLTTGRDGRAHAQLVPGTYECAVSGCRKSSRVVVGATGTVQAALVSARPRVSRLATPPAVSLTARVLDSASGTPISRVRVHIATSDGRPLLARSAVCDASGILSIDGVRSGPLWIKVSSAGHAAFLCQRTAGGERLDLGTIHLIPHIEVCGRVVNQSNAPLANAILSYRMPADPSNAVYQRGKRSANAEGVFTMSVPDGAVLDAISRDGTQRATSPPITVRARDLRMVARRTAIIRGSTALRHMGAKLLLFAGESAVGTTTPDAFGEFSFAVAPGEYRLVLQSAMAPPPVAVVANAGRTTRVRFAHDGIGVVADHR